tara:strand:+ start:2051 stop:2584 length:534 start_codon:yes stop_codon:yes gene_type:complete
MIFEKITLNDVYLIKLEKNYDERGFFARSFCLDEFKKNGINISIKQCNISFNTKTNTLRGMHYQDDDEYGEEKIIRCTRGKIYDVIIDLRKESHTYLQWQGISLDATTHNALYVPKGFAHGFQTLTENTEVYYHMTAIYKPELSSGIRWDDPIFNIQWPNSSPILSEKDASYSNYQP